MIHKGFFRLVCHDILLTKNILRGDIYCGIQNALSFCVGKMKEERHP